MSLCSLVAPFQAERSSSGADWLIKMILEYSRGSGFRATDFRLSV